MSAVDPEQIRMFISSREWVYAEAAKLGAPICSPDLRTSEHAWRQLMELSDREEQLSRELTRFLNKQKEKS